MRIRGRIAIIYRFEPQRRFLRKARHHHVARCPTDLAAFIQEYRGEFRSKDLFRALLVVKPTEPDFRAIGKRIEPVRFVQLRLCRNSWKAPIHHLGKRIVDNGPFQVIEPVAHHDMAAFVGQSPYQNRP